MCDHTYMYTYICAKGENGERNGDTAEHQLLPSTSAVKPHPPVGLDSPLIKTPPKRTTGDVISVRMHTYSLPILHSRDIVFEMYMYMSPHVARKHTGKVGRRASPKIPAAKPNGRHISPESTEGPPSSVSERTNANDTEAVSTTASPQNVEEDDVENQSNDKEEMAVAVSTQNGDTAMDTSADSANNRSEGEKSTEVKAEATPTTVRSEDKKSVKDATKTKAKVHPLFGE